MTLADSGQASASARQEQDGLLDVRREEQQVHDRGDPGAGDVGQAHQVGVVGDLALVHKVLHPDGQSHEAGDARHAAERQQFRRLTLLHHVPGAAPEAEAGQRPGP